MTIVIVNLIIYAVIAVIVCAIVDHFDKNVNGDDCAAISIMWPIIAIAFICYLPRIAFDYIKDVWHDKFSKEMKEHKRAESRKLVEDVLISIKKEKRIAKAKKFIYSDFNTDYTKIPQTFNF